MKLPHLMSLCVGAAAVLCGSGCATAKPVTPVTVASTPLAAEELPKGSGYATTKSVTPVSFASTQLAVEELRKGSVDAVVGDYPTMAFVAREAWKGFGEELEVIGEQFQPSPIGIAVKKDRTAMLKAVTVALRSTMLEPTYMNILGNWALWIGKVDPPADPGPVPHTDVVPELADGTMKVGMEMAFAPMEFFDELKQESGVDVELARALGKQLGVEVELVNMPFNELLPALTAGDIDIVISAMTITPERSASADFLPYMLVGTGIMLKPGNRTNIEQLVDLCGKTVALQEGTAQAELLAGIPCDQ